MPKRVLIIKSDYYQHVTEKLVEGALEELKKHDIKPDIITVEGVLEIPSTLAIAVENNMARIESDGHADNAFDGYILLGCVIRGETSHYDIVANESARLCLELATWEQLALGIGILTVENEDQALARADKSKKNKGGDAARAMLSVLEAKARLEQIL